MRYAESSGREDKMKNKNKKINFSMIFIPVFMLIYGITLFSVAGFSGHNSVFWVSFIFECIAFLSLEATLLLFGERIDEVRDWIFSIPLYKHLTTYFAVEFIASTVFICLSKKIPFFLIMILQAAVFAIFLAFALSCFTYKEKVKNIRADVTDSTEFMKKATLQLEMLSKNGSGDKIKAIYGDLYKKYVYSDPVSIAETKDVESEILQLLENAKFSDDETAEFISKEISRLFDERNYKCKNYKIY